MKVTRTLVVVASAAVAIAVGACSGSKGAKGDPGVPGALVKTTAEPSGTTNCGGLGGTKIEVGIDGNDNGTLDPAEVTSTQYVCNGAGAASLVKVTQEPSGTNCAVGGLKIESGVDVDGNGTLDPAEVTSTQYVCNGAGAVVSPADPSSSSTGLSVSVVSVTTAAGSPVAVRFMLKDDRGFPIDVNGVYSYNTSFLASGTNSSIRFALAYATVGADGNVSPYTVMTNSGSGAGSPTAFTPTSAGQGTLVENAPPGRGDYTYTFPTTSLPTGAKAVAYDPAQLGQTHTVWIQATRQRDRADVTNPKTFTAVNKSCDFIPSSAPSPFACDAAGTLRREIVATSGCFNCHKGFKPEGSVGAAFHSGGRVDARFCNICHNPGRTSNPDANSKVFVHRIHRGEHLQPGNLFHDIAATYPQDIRNCNACHAGALQGGQAQSNPTQQACGSCHDYVNFAAADPTKPNCFNVRAVAGSGITDVATGLPVPCNHSGGEQVGDTTCTVCHTAAKINDAHLAINPPNPANARNTTGFPWGYQVGTASLPAGTNSNTNAAYVAGAGSVPTGASAITYQVSSVDAVPDPVPAYAALKRPQIKFKLKQDGADVVFQDPAVATEIMANFVGSPSVIFAFAVPQDGIAQPVDFNVTATGYIKSIWNGTAAPKTTGTATSGIGGPDGKTACTAGAPCTCSAATPCSVSGAGTISGPDAGGFYTITLTGVQIPASAVLLTGGVGYSYSLSSAPPLTQTNVAGFPYGADGQGGIIIPAPDVWKVATGYTGRRAIVDNSTCDTCHQPLGVAPDFHAGQRNDGPTCAFCHNANRTSSGWSANAKNFIHALHGARKRQVPFTWHATCPPAPTVCTIDNAQGFWDVDFPPALNTCQACHLPGMNDFSNAAYLPFTSGTRTSGTQGAKTCTAASPCTCSTADPCSNDIMDRMLSAYVAVGTSPYTNVGSLTSPYVDLVTTYGAGFSYNASTDVFTQAAATTKYVSPIVSACSACHDTQIAIDHMQSNGGSFYADRGSLPTLTPPGPVSGTREQCLICHGPGRIAAIAEMHR